jgi:hypothetical protein
MKVIFNYSMSVVYLLAGIFLLVKGWQTLDPLKNKLLGALLIAYGVFRAFRIYKSLQVAGNKDDSESNNLTDSE